jgi:arabinan endo-1,5-alpha-L-arabinosidase
MVIHAGDTYYVFGSHLAAAKSRDLMAWSLIDAGVKDDSRIIPNVTQEMKEALDWGQTRTFWAGSVIQLADGRYYYYYTVCKGDSPRSAIGVAVADKPEGPYRNQGILLRSGMWGQAGEDGTIYDATTHPNTTDTHLFRDTEGRLWMDYGSYSGGIYILRMDDKTGRPLAGQGYGKKLAGGNHSCIEAPSILYSPDSGYYYLFLSFGGLNATGGYQIRVARSRNPDGPYLDPQGHDMIDAHGPNGSFFDLPAIEPYGAKLIGNFQFVAGDGKDGVGYLSPGHNSDCYDPATGKYFIFFHTRFPGRGEQHQVRVHQLLLNGEGWPVIAPNRYAGETLASISADQIAGEYQYINHGRRITPEITRSQTIRLDADGTVRGEVQGSWKKTGDHTLMLKVDGLEYHGVVLRQWDSGRSIPVISFSALSSQGVAIWGNSVLPAPGS